VAFAFGTDEPVAEALKRCAREQLEYALGQMSEEIESDPVMAVHAARKALKKERALLRLSRGSLGGRQRRAEIAAIRNVARSLSGARDADVMIQSLDALAERFSGQLPESSFREVRKRLVRARTSERTQTKRAQMHGDALQLLREALRRVDDWTIGRRGWAAIDRGLLRTYQDGRSSFARARKRPTVENVHAWRKRVKDLWYELRLLEPTCGPAARGQAEEAHRLADLLGDDHDLAVLGNAVVAMHTDIPADIDGLIALIGHRRERLQSEALHIGERLYVEKPKAFRRRMRRYWQAGRAELDSARRSRPAELAELTRQPATV
jgi:CHAD domain-containing protein